MVSGQCSVMEGEVFFLQTSGHASSLLTDARKALSRPGFKLIDIGEKDIGRVIEESPLQPVIVVDMFEGEVFQRIKDLKGIRIVSALLLIEVNPKSYFAIPTHPSPLESMSMYGLKIYLSGYPKHSLERRAMKKKIKRMGGTLSDRLRSSTTQIVLKDWETKTAKEIRKDPDIILNISIMSPEWVDHCYDNRNKNIGKADSQELITRFRMKLFQNFLFSTTGFSEKERIVIEQNVVTRGGTFNTSLILPRAGDKPTSHLITNHPHGLKYNRALQDSPDTHIVEFAWFRDSIKRDRPIPLLERIYSLRPTQEDERPFRPPTTTQTHRAPTVSATPRASNARSVPALENSIQKLQELIADKQRHDLLFEGCSFCFIALERKSADLARNLIRMCGGSVYTEPTSVVTHLLIGPDLVKRPDKLKEIYRAEERFHPFSKVNLAWVINSKEAGEMLPEKLDEALEELFRLPRPPLSQEPNLDQFMECARAIMTPKNPRRDSTTPTRPQVTPPQDHPIHESESSYNPHTSIYWDS